MSNYVQGLKSELGLKNIYYITNVKIMNILTN